MSGHDYQPSDQDEYQHEPYMSKSGRTGSVGSAAPRVQPPYAVPSSAYRLPPTGPVYGSTQPAPAYSLPPSGPMYLDHGSAQASSAYPGPGSTGPAYPPPPSGSMGPAYPPPPSVSVYATPLPGLAHSGSNSAYPAPPHSKKTSLVTHRASVPTARDPTPLTKKATDHIHSKNFAGPSFGAYKQVESIYLERGHESQSKLSEEERAMDMEYKHEWIMTLQQFRKEGLPELVELMKTMRFFDKSITEQDAKEFTEWKHNRDMHTQIGPTNPPISARSAKKKSTPMADKKPEEEDMDSEHKEIEGDYE